MTPEDKIAEERAKKIALKVERIFLVITQDLINSIDAGKALNSDTLRLLNEYEAILQESIYDETFEDFLELYGDRAEEVQARLSKISGSSVNYTGADIATMDAIINTDFDLINNSAMAAGTTVRQEVVRGVLLGRAGQIDTSVLSTRLRRNVETEVRTGEMAFSRTVNNSKAIDIGFTKFKYIGPNDKFNRPFCKHHVGKVYTSEEIAELDNGQGLEVFQFGGGYNCRHYWQPVVDGTDGD